MEGIPVGLGRLGNGRLEEAVHQFLFAGRPYAAEQKQTRQQHRQPNSSNIHHPLLLHWL
jgi:hypothetical protein